MPTSRTRAVIAVSLVSALTVTGGAAYIGTRVTPRAVAEPAPIVAGVTVPGITTALVPDHPALRMRVASTDDSPVDTLAGQFLSDILDFWDTTEMPQGKGFFAPPHVAASFDSRTGKGASVCVDTDTVNAAACRKLNGQTSIEWDRGELLPSLIKTGNILSAGVVLAHETGHLVDFQLRDPKSFDETRTMAQTLVNEQKADCYAGSWLAYVGSGSSRRFTADPKSLGEALYSILSFRDTNTVSGHGIGVERVNAAMRGFVSGPDVCAQIDREFTTANRQGILLLGSSTSRKRWEPMTEDDVQDIRDEVGTVTGTAPKVSGDPCPDTEVNAPAATWCASRGEVSLDYAAFGAFTSDAPRVAGEMREGPGHRIGPLLAAMVQPYLTESGVPSTSGATSCAVGVTARALASKNHGDLLDFGDLDEILSETLTTGRSGVASDGSVEEWAFNRAKDFLDGLYRVQSVEGCLGR